MRTSTCERLAAVRLQLSWKSGTVILIERIRDILERVSDRVRGLAGVLRELPENRQLAPETVPVRVDR